LFKKGENQARKKRIAIGEKGAWLQNARRLRLESAPHKQRISNEKKGLKYAHVALEKLVNQSHPHAAGDPSNEGLGKSGEIGGRGRFDDEVNRISGKRLKKRWEERVGCAKQRLEIWRFTSRGSRTRL